jgi:hypothetical protein
LVRQIDPLAGCAIGFLPLVAGDNDVFQIKAIDKVGRLCGDENLFGLGDTLNHRRHQCYRMRMQAQFRFIEHQDVG